MEAAFILLFVSAVTMATVGHLRSDERKAKRAIRKAPKTTLASLSEGELGRLRGRIRDDGHTLISPIDGKTCIFYVAIVEEYHFGGSHNAWRELIRESRICDFHFEDEHGQVRVIAQGARVATELTVIPGSLPIARQPERVRQFLTKHGRMDPGWLASRKLRYREGVLRAGDEVIISALGTREPELNPTDGAKGYRETNMRWVLSGSRKQPVCITDDLTTWR